MSTSHNLLRTTRAVRDVKTIGDIVAIESEPYDKNVAAHSLYDLLSATAGLHPQRLALTVLAGDPSLKPLSSLTHSQLLFEATRAANLFASLNGGKESVVAVLCPSLPEAPVALLGAQVVGVVSAINYLLGVDAIADLLVAQRATVLIVPGFDQDHAIAEKVQPILERVAGIETVLHIGEVAPARSSLSYSAAVRPHPGDRLQASAPSDRSRVCALFHTGGTTGRPKLVRLTHGNQIHAAWSFAQVHGLDEHDIAIDGFPLFHVGGTITAGLSVMAAGGHVVIPSPYALRKPEVVRNYWRIVERYGATIVSGVPTSIASLAEVPIAGCNLSSVRMGLTGGAVLPRAVGERFESRTGILLYETYGMTETAAAISFNPGRGERTPGSVGFRAPYAETLIAKRDNQGLSPCPPLVSGSVLVRGPQVFPGYVDPDHNHGVLGADGWLVTGDIGYLTQDQRLVLTGREKDLIIRSGHNIDPASIEDVANGFPGVQISAAVGMPDSYAGEAPILFAVPAPGRTLDMEELMAHVAKHVSEPPARPKRVVLLEALPVTAVGKIFKPALRDLAIRENVLVEVEQIFGPGVKTTVEIERDEKLRTIVIIAVESADTFLRERLMAELLKLPQTYVLLPA